MRSTCLVTLAVGLTSMSIMQANAQSFTTPLTMNADVGSKALQANVNVNMSGFGSGVNGPETAQFGANMSCTKNGWQGTNTPGEIDCVHVTVNQGGPNSDARGIVVNTQNTGMGFSNGLEAVASSVTVSNDAIPYFQDLQVADVTSDGQTAGAVFNMVSGSGIGLAIDTQNNASWTNLLQAAKGGNVFFEITGNGSVVTSGVVTANAVDSGGVVHAAASIVTELPKSQLLKKASCGTTLRSVDRSPVTLIVPSGLPLGCHIDVIQANVGAITIEGRDVDSEHLGSPARQLFKTTGPSAQAELLIDSRKSFLLRGEVQAADDKSLAFVSFHPVIGDDDSFSLMR